MFGGSGSMFRLRVTTLLVRAVETHTKPKYPHARGGGGGARGGGGGGGHNRSLPAYLCRVSIFVHVIQNSLL